MEISLAAPYGLAPEKPMPSTALMELARMNPVRSFRVGKYKLDVVPYDECEIYVYKENGEILYLCVAERHRNNRRQIFIQKNVWQLPGCSRGFARVIMRFFCTDGRILASDSRQRKKGADMWRKFITEDCDDMNVYVQSSTGLSKIEAHTKSMMLAFAYSGNADDKIFVVSDEPITAPVRAWENTYA